MEDVGHEDPVTGSLSAGLAQWLIGSRIAPSEYVVSQGTVVRAAFTSNRMDLRYGWVAWSERVSWVS